MEVNLKKIGIKKSEDNIITERPKTIVGSMVIQTDWMTLGRNGNGNSNKGQDQSNDLFQI